MIDWSKLEAYRNSKPRSFEELCYQIAKGLFGHIGEFTRIDDSGGGDGVEFYMTSPDGNEWGWQAKFYHPEPRLSVSNRKAAIKNSLVQACRKHPRLKKWILCTPTNFTQNEQNWFRNTLPESVQSNMDVVLGHWGESNFNNWLSEPRFKGKKLHFFGELELTVEWFHAQFDKQVAGLGDKFDAELHVETDIDTRIHTLLADTLFTRQLVDLLTSLGQKLEDWREAVADLNNNTPPEVDWSDSKFFLLTKVKPLEDALLNTIGELKRAQELLSERGLNGFRLLEWDATRSQLQQAYDAYKEAESAFDGSKLTYKGDERDQEWILRKAGQIVSKPGWVVADMVDISLGMMKQIDFASQSDLHILGGAGVGKTHVAANICNARLNIGIPALFVLGSHFTGNGAIEQQLLHILDIPSSYSWNDFLQALESVAEAYGTRIPLVIDGLNEATLNGAFSYSLWRLGLRGLIQEIGRTNNVVLITTCRTTYNEAIWPNNPPRSTVYIDGFHEPDVEVAIQRYFSYYKIKADLTASPISQFKLPIFLRIFCESQNPARREEKHVYVGEYSLFEVFESYLRQCNRSICDRLGLYRRAPMVTQALNKIAEYLWEHSSRHVPLREMVEIVDGRPLEDSNWEHTKTKAILDEGLLVCRDWLGDGEVVYFTYDLLGGYLIARCLVQRATDNIELFVRSREATAKLFGNNYTTLHPLHNSICRCFAALLPIQAGRYLHDFRINRKASSLSTNALFELPPDSVNEACLDLVATLFDHPQNRKRLLRLASSTVGNVHHPMNMSFWSGRLRALSMRERDVSWTEYVREDVKQFERIIRRFEEFCQTDEALSDTTTTRLDLLAEYVMWILTSTVRPLRDKATRALYWYGRRVPNRFFELVLSSLELNDPHVPERMLAAAYGVSMARQHDFRDSSFVNSFLLEYAKNLYEAMFAPNAPYSTTHILARDYARRTIEIALIHHPNLLEAEGKKRISPPFLDGGIREWGKSEDRNEGEYRDGNAPIHMDFRNYTIGRLVKDRANYDFEHEEYKKVRDNIFWRIYDLGYSFEVFGDIDKPIARLNWGLGRATYGGKTDRYGKKYSWIAFYELAGFRQDQGLLDEWYAESRISDADIDPSFPLPVQEFLVIDEDLLGDRVMPLHEWIENGDIPEIFSYCVLEELCGERGPWVLLDGYVSQEDLKARRSCIIFPRGLFVQKDDSEEVVSLLEEQGPNAAYPPGIPEDYYTYAGEIPWCDTFPHNNRARLEIFAVPKKKEVVSSQPLTSKVDIIPSEEERKTEVLGEKRVFEVVIPVRKNVWEYYHSIANLSRSVLIPAKEIAEYLDLCSQPQTFDLYEKNGKRASITVSWGEPWHTEHNLVFLRQDLLSRYLLENDLRLIWVLWGRREFRSKSNEGLNEFSREHKPSESFKETRSFSLKIC